MTFACPLCRSTEILNIPAPDFLRCGVCALIFRNPAGLLGAEEERERYNLHDNSDTPAYRLHLARLLIPLTKCLAPGAHGLDFGCGPSPLLSQMLNEQGFPTANFDPYFFNEPEVLLKNYDFVVCCEVVEHFYSPSREFPRLVSLLKPGGWLGIMTQSPPANLGEFGEWYYQRDPTHVVFYSAETFRWLEQKFSLAWQSHGKGVSLFQKL